MKNQFPQDRKIFLKRYKMLKSNSDEFKKIFLLEFTKQLIKNSSTAPFSILETEIKKEQQEEKENIKKLINKQENPFAVELEKEFTQKRIFHPSTQNANPRLRILKIPSPRFPKNLQYLAPIPVRVEIDLNELNPLIKNQLIESIECHGPDEKLILNGVKGTKTIDLILTENQIETIIQKFSSLTKIPYETGIFNAAYGTLEISAIISEEVGSRFIIKRIKPPQQQQRIF